MERTSRLELPLLLSGQAGKEVTHNEALLLLDLLIGGVVDGVGVDAPPMDAEAGRCWIVGGTPTGAWTGHANATACRTEGGWRFVPAREGLKYEMRGSGVPVCYRDGEWRTGEVVADRILAAGQPVIGPRQAAIGNPSGGTVVDVEARAALDGVLTALRSHGLVAT